MTQSEAIKLIEIVTAEANKLMYRLAIADKKAFSDYVQLLIQKIVESIEA